MFFSGKEIIGHRQKLIRIADDSEMGWRTVKEYDINPLVEDSDDEKRLLRAESRANRKAKQQKMKKSQRRFTPYGRWSSTAVSTPPAHVREQSMFSDSRRPGLCFFCRKSGHWKKDCPELPRQNNKISILEISRGNDEEMYLKGNEKQNIVDSKLTCDKFGPNEPTQNSIENRTESNELWRKNNQSDSPVGRLKSAKSAWETAGANDYIMRVVTEGYTLPFRELPPVKRMQNNKSARENMGFVKEEVCKLLEKGCVKEVTEVPFVTNPLTVAFNRTGKPRLVLDCRHINQYLIQYKYKYEDINTALEMFDLGSYLFSYDLKGAYHHISIKSEHTQYLGFSITIDKVTRYFVFCVLPFGIATAGHIFSKVLRVVVKFLRSQGHKVVMYLDDGIGGHKKYDAALQLSTHVRATLIEFGFLLAHDKCHWDPTSVKTWLGYILDMSQGKLFVTYERIERASQAIESMLKTICKTFLVRVQALASVVGQIISMQAVFGKLVCLRTRALHECIISRASWKALVMVTADALCELKFWKSNMKELNRIGRPLSVDFSSDIEIFCDASSEGYGGYLCIGRAPVINYSVVCQKDHKNVQNRNFEGNVSTSLEGQSKQCCCKSDALAITDSCNKEKGVSRVGGNSDAIFDGSITANGCMFPGERNSRKCHGIQAVDKREPAIIDGIDDVCNISEATCAGSLVMYDGGIGNDYSIAGNTAVDASFGKLADDNNTGELEVIGIWSNDE